MSSIVWNPSFLILPSSLHSIELVLIFHGNSQVPFLTVGRAPLGVVSIRVGRVPGIMGTTATRQIDL